MMTAGRLMYGVFNVHSFRFTHKLLEGGHDAGD